MKYFLFAVALTIASATTALAGNAAVSVTMGQPGFYGRIDIGDYPQPRVIYTQPIVVERVYIKQEPIYMRVPLDHSKNWRKHCHTYKVCNERVYFVQDSWYRNDYIPHYKARHGHNLDKRRDNHRGNERHNKNHGKNH